MPRFRTCRASTARARSSKARRRVYKPGDEVLVTGYELGAGHWGGYSQIRARAGRVDRAAARRALTLRDTMIYGTAGFTAAQCVTAIVERGITPDRGPVVVTGATGGVGSLAVAILAKLGYEVAAVTGKAGAARLAAPAGCGHDSRSRRRSRRHATGRCSRHAGPRRSTRSAAQPLATILRSHEVSRLSSPPADWWPATELRAHRLSVHPPRRDAGRHRFGQMPAAAAARDVAKAVRPVARRKSRRLADEVTLDDLPDRVQKILAGQIVGRTLVVPTSQEPAVLTAPETAGSIRTAPSSSRVATL